jgi:ATP-dependent DNA ligase
MARGKKLTTGAVPPAALEGTFPSIDLPVRPPFSAMLAKSADALPSGPGWVYEPKWDGFRCLVFRRDDEVLLQSRAGQPLARYFPEMVNAFRALPASRFVLDGEIVIVVDGVMSFDDLLQRIHPADSRVQMLARETPGTFLAFDLLVDATGESLLDRPLRERRAALERFFAALPQGGAVRLSPATEDHDVARRWMTELPRSGLEGVMAKILAEPYHAGDRHAMRKIKAIRTADCVVAGFRYAQAGGEIGSLLLGLYDDEGRLNHVGFASSFTAEERRALKPIVEPLVGGTGFTGSAPGGPSRWANERSTEWTPLQPSLVCEVRYDHFSGDRFRHGTKLLRWRPDKPPRDCTLDQVTRTGTRGLLARMGIG